MDSSLTTKNILRWFVVVSLLIATPWTGWILAQGQSEDQTPNVHIVRSNDEGILVEYLMPNPEVFTEAVQSGVGGRLVIPGMSLYQQPGKPQLPIQSVLLGIPPSGEVSLNVIQAEGVILPGTYDVPPSPQPASMEEDLQPAGWLIGGEGYVGLQTFPQSPASITDEAWLRSQRLIRLELFPFQYNPSQKTLVWYPRLLVEIRFSSQARKAAQSAASGCLFARCFEAASFESVLQSALLNYDQAKTWRIPPYQNPQLSAPAPVFADFAPSNSGEKYKIVVDTDGLYTVTYADLVAAGMNVGSVNPQNFQMTNQGRGVAIYVSGEGDGSFDPSDGIYFYGEQFRGDYLASLYASEGEDWLYLFNGGRKSDFNATMLEKYTQDNVYWLTVGSTSGLRMTTVSGDPTGSLASTPQTFTETIHAEQQIVWWTFHFTSEDTWFWDHINDITAPVTRNYSFTLTNVATGAYNATIRAEVVPRNHNPDSSPDHHTKFYIQNTSQLIDDAYWDGKDRYSFQSVIPQSQLVEGNNILILWAEKTAGMTSDRLYFDWFEVEYQRLYQAQSDELTFGGDTAGTWKYQVPGFTSADIRVFDITNPLLPTQFTSPEIVGASGTFTVTFEATHGAGAEFIAAGSSGVHPPKQITRYVPPNFAGLPEADYIFITHADFAATLQTLANFRAGQGMSTLIVDVADLYNEFNYGIYHPIAIKNFLAYTFANWLSPPEYVLLVGSGHWNFHGSPNYGNPAIYMPPYLAFLDLSQGEVDSANQLAMLVGDDILPDVHIGRLPVNNTTELNTVINKIIAYEGAPEASWQTYFTFVADNTPDSAGDFVAMSESAISKLPPGANVDRIYSNDYANDAAQVRTAIANSLNITGTLVLNYVGHGSIQRWAHEEIFRNADVATLTNINQLPVVLSMTCLDAYWIYPNQQSLINEMLFYTNGGAVTTFSPTGLGVATGHDVLHAGFYDAVFHDNEQVMGPVTLLAKLDLYATGQDLDLIQTFTIFGDPALHIQVPSSLEPTPTPTPTFTNTPTPTFTHTPTPTPTPSKIFIPIVVHR
ncbi:MAG: C25 family cysteine peptidase [Chloroflexota bacterium]